MSNLSPRLRVVGSPAGFSPGVRDVSLGERVSRAEPPEDRELFRMVYSSMRRLVGPHQDFDDLVQKGMLEVFRAVPRFRGEAKWNTFVYAICYRVWTKHLRWSGRFLRRFLLSTDGSVPEQTCERSFPSDTLLAKERWARLYAGLELVSPKRRAVLVLHDLEGVELEEIATIVGCGVSTVRTRLRDGRQALRKVLEADPMFSVEEVLS